MALASELTAAVALARCTYCVGKAESGAGQVQPVWSAVVCELLGSAASFIDADDSSQTASTVTQARSTYCVTEVHSCL